MKRTLLWLVLILCLMGSVVLAQDGGELTVNAAESIGTVSPTAFGANFGPLQTIPADLIEEAQESGIAYLRFPAGRWGDLNDITHSQIDMLMRSANMINAQVGISARLENGTPEQAAELVRYTQEKEYDILYWSIGNEPNLFDDYTTEDLNTEWRAIAEAMLEVDPDLTLIGPDVSQWNGVPGVDPVDSEGRDFMREFLRANGDLIDIVTVHRYPFPLSMAYPVTSIDDLRGNVNEWSTILPNLRAVIEEETGRDLPVAVTEFNSHWSSNVGGEATPDSHYNAIWLADILGRLLQEEPVITGYFDMQSTARGGWGLLARYEVRPTYYVYQLYQRFGTELVQAESTVENLSIYAALNEDGALTLLLVNLADDMQSAPLALNGFTPGGPAEVRVLDPEHNAEQLDDLDITDGMELTLPGQSATLLTIPTQTQEGS